MYKKKPIDCVQVKVVTWEKESHGLFDYEDKRAKQLNYHIDNTCILFQNHQRDHELQLTQESNIAQLKNSEHLTLLGKMNINHNTGSFSFERQEPLKNGPNSRLEPYLVIRSLKDDQNQQRGYSLKQGDSIKLGRLQYNVLEYRNKNSAQQAGVLNTNFETHLADQTYEGTCKFCLCEESDQNNFLISPCNCKGSCMAVHLECLKQWIQNKIHKESYGAVDQYNFKKFECEICKVPYPQKVVRREREFDMLIIDRPKHPYIIFETNSNEHKNLFMLSFKEGLDTIKIGRGHQCEMRITDISVSRIHATIAYKNGKFLLYDNASKFGTLVRIPQKLSLSEDRCAIQVGRTVLVCSVKPLSLLKAKKEEGLSIKELQSTRA